MTADDIEKLHFQNSLQQPRNDNDQLPIIRLQFVLLLFILDLICVGPCDNIGVAEFKSEALAYHNAMSKCHACPHLSLDVSGPMATYSQSLAKKMAAGRQMFRSAWSKYGEIVAWRPCGNHSTAGKILKMMYDECQDYKYGQRGMGTSGQGNKTHDPNCQDHSPVCPLHVSLCTNPVKQMQMQMAGRCPRTCGIC